MAVGYVSGETMLRPIRVGLVIMPDSAAGLCRRSAIVTSNSGSEVSSSGESDVPSPMSAR
jgi:hypothetical protein